MAKNIYQKQGEVSYQRQEKINSELLSLTYGSLVAKLLKEHSIEEVNQQLEKTGYNIGIRLIDEYLAKTSMFTCDNLTQIADAVAKTAFKMFLNVSCEVIDITSDSFSLQFLENPLNDFVELPEEYNELCYSNLLCGVIRGAFEML